MNASEKDPRSAATSAIIVDGDHVSRVAFDLIVQFERMLGRRIPDADVARWAECAALDGGIRGQDNRVDVVILHSKGRHKMENFAPSDYATDLNAKAFRSALGEFALAAHPYEGIIGRAEQFAETVTAVCSDPHITHVVIVPDDSDAAMLDTLRHTLRRNSGNKRVTVLAMQPLPGGNFCQEILGYSLMQALGIRGDELDAMR